MFVNGLCSYYHHAASLIGLSDKYIYITMNMNVIDLCSVKFQIKVHLVRVLIGKTHYGKYI